MKRILLLTVTLLFTAVLLPSPAVRTQQEPEVDMPPPNPADYPAARENCKRQVQMSPWVGTPSVVFTKTARCMMTIITCEGLKTFKSGARAEGAEMCSDYWASHNALAQRVICCDGVEAEENSERKPCGTAPPSWFQSSDCKDRQDPVIEQTRDTVSIYLCGYKIFTGRKPTYDSRLYESELRRSLEQDMPRKICCNEFREAARTGVPCNARADVDCDGKPNDSDLRGTGIPSIDGQGFNMSKEALANYDLFPPGLSEDEIMPPPDQCKDCRWELVKGELRCSPDGRADHNYTATWRCPATGFQTVKTHRARASAPCTQPSRTRTE